MLAKCRWGREALLVTGLDGIAAGPDAPCRRVVYLHEHVAVQHLRVLVDVGDVVDGRTGNVPLGEQEPPLVLGLVAHGLREQVLQFTAVLHAPVGGLEARVFRQRSVAGDGRGHHVGGLEPERLRAAVDLHPLVVAAAERLGRDVAGVAGADGLRRDAGCEIERGEVCLE